MRLLMRSYGAPESEHATMGTSATPFEQLGFGDLSRAMLCLVRFASSCEPGMDPLMMENHLLHQALEEVAAIIDDWPEEFHRICNQYPDRCSSRLASHLFKVADRPSLVFLRMAMEEHWIMEGHWIKVAQRSSPVYDPPPSRRFIPMEEAGERMGLSREWVNFLVSTGRLRSAASVSDSQTTLIDVKTIDNLFRDQRRLIATKTAAANLGISIEELFDLIAYGHLRIAGGPQIDGCPDTAVEVEALLNLYESIEKISSPASETVITELMNFNEVRKQLQAKNLNLGLWLQAVIDSEVVPFKQRPRFVYDRDYDIENIRYDIENIRLARFAFRRDQIRQYLYQAGTW